MGILEDFASWLVYGVLGVAFGGRDGVVLEFFVADIIKVFFLLIAAIFLVSLLRTYITPQKVKKLLGGRKEGFGNALAALLGIPTPFCSCSAVPLFIGFVESGVPLGVTFSFLVASPLINEIALALLFSLFGWKIALLYVASGLAIAIACGMIIGRLKLEGEVEDFVYSVRSKKTSEKKQAWAQRVAFAKSETKSIVFRVAPYIFVGIAIGALIHGAAPVGFLSQIAGKDNPLAVPIAVAVGVPLYSNAAGMVPIVEALTSKGMAFGTALAFMMSVTALSLPEMIMLRRVLKPRLLAVFIIILALSFTLTGIIFNMLL